MKRILGWLCIVSILVMSMTAGTIVSFAATETASVTDIYATGNWKMGNEVTAHYTTQDSNAKIQWYRIGNLKAGTAIDGATSSKYTIQRGDVYDSFTSVYFTVTDSSNKVFYSPIYQAARDTDTTADKYYKAHLILKGGATSFVPGATVGIDHNTAFIKNSESACTYEYEWRIKETRGATDYEVAGAGTTYTIQEDDYGKFLEAAITINCNETVLKEYTAIAYVGGKFDFDAKITNYSNCYNATTANTLWYQSEDFIYNNKNANVSVVIDAGKTVVFDGFDLYVKNVDSNLKISYSTDNSTWNDLPLTGTLTGNIKTNYTFDNVYTAQYFKVTYKTKSGSYGNLYEAYPYLSAANKDAVPAAPLGIESIGYGAKVDGSANVISNISYNTPADVLAASVVATRDDAVITLTDAAGEAVANASNVKLTPANIDDYRIKIVSGEESKVYTLATGALKTIDISSMTDDVTKKYTINEVKNPETDANESTGHGKNLPGTKATYWYSSAEYDTDAATTADAYPYGIREVVDGENAMAIHTNGNPRSDSGVADIWYTVTDLDDKGSYSFTFKVKPDADSNIQVMGRPYHNLNTVEFVGHFVQLNTTGLFVHNGTELVRKADFAEDEWYNIEVVVDYKNMKKSVWVNGVNYVDGATLEFSSETFNKGAFSMGIKILASPNGANDVNYIKDIEFNKVWDVNTKISADGEALGMKLYNGDAVVDTLVAGIYSAKGNGNVFSDEYYVAVYKVEYADNTKTTETSCSLIKAYRIDGSKTAQIANIEVPESAYTETSNAVVKIFCFNNGLKPARDCALID